MKMNINNLCDGLRSAPPPALSALALPIDIARPSNPFSFFAKPRSAFPDDLVGASVFNGVTACIIAL